MRDLPATLRKVLRYVIQNLSAVMCGGFGPARGFTRGFDCISNILAVTEPYFAEPLAALTPHFHTVAGIRPRLFAPDIEFYRAVNVRGRSRGLRFVV